MIGNAMSIIFGVVLSLLSGVVLAEDIDLFVGKSTASSDAPNVLLVLDNSANFEASVDFAGCPGVAAWPTTLGNTAAAVEQCAIYKVVEALEPDRLNLAIMTYNGNTLCGGVGGCLVRPLVFMTDARKTELLAWIKSWKTTGQNDVSSINIKANSRNNATVMQEAWAFFAGRMGVSGRNYEALKPSGTCGKNFVVFLGNSNGSSGKPGDPEPPKTLDPGVPGPRTALMGTLTGTSAAMNASPPSSLLQRTLIESSVAVSCGTGGTFSLAADGHEANGFYADEWSRYMRSQGITTYSVGFLGAACTQSYEALLSSMASQGGGAFFRADNLQKLVDALSSAFSQIQSTNSAFSAVSLPLSAGAQGAFLNQIYVGMFRPEKTPRWQGNLKQYKLGYSNFELKLLDADGDPAISSAGTGFVADCARSFWTPSKSESPSSLYWENLSLANCVGYSPKSETPDGNIVEKGGQGYKLRSVDPGSRVVKTCGSSCVESLSDFNSSNTAITAAALGVIDANRTSLINWARGQNTDGEAITGKSLDQARAMMRPSAHGDVVHSRPAVIDYGSSGSPDVVVFYGANDGMLRAVNGNRGGGQELWSFVAPESYGLFARLRANTQLVKFPNVEAGAPKSYGFDGAVTAYKNSTKAWIFAGMRRGGRMMYAFDVSSPANPKLKWRLGCPRLSDDSGCITGFDSMGQTWATPTVLTSVGYMNEGVQKPMIIFGGGYDSCEDDDSKVCSAAKGRSIYVVDADSGALLKSFGTDGGVVGDIAVVESSQGHAMYAYAADLGGNLYRISGGANSSIGAVPPKEWVITKIANLGGGGTDRRKFMFGPDVVAGDKGYYILLGSGDREKPILGYKNASSANNYFFMVKDQPTNAGWLASESTTCTKNEICLGSLYPITDSDTPDQASIDAKKGWYLILDPTEKVVTQALTLYGTVYFSSHLPLDTDSAQACAPDLGETRSYAIRLSNASAARGASRYEHLVGDGLPPSPFAGLVTLDNGTVVPVCFGCSSSSGFEGSFISGEDGGGGNGGSGAATKARVFWNIEQ